MIGPKKVSASAPIPIWQRVHENAQGGFTLDKTGLVDGQLIPGGSPFGYNEATRLARVIKQATMAQDAGAADLDYYVKKDHNLAVGEIYSPAIGGKAYAITAIDTSDPAKDKISFGTTLGAVLAGAVIFQSSATGATAGAFIVTPRGLLYADVYVETNKEVTITIRGTVYERRIPGTHGSIKAAIPNIIYSQSY
ncbi:MAG: hypothetical protein BGO55_00615 [Sphingobacteriales bacterium 50-39]|nr:hypothetical protein [Sphingobacteriales bacterium]OJW53617.1 MAG: hypothetical protein BGO55_00615 [Sphingobacteriales bacterium 50-39]